MITVHPWAGEDSPPSAQLPMCSVRFFARGSIAHARCDCRQGGNCAHVVLAVLAFAQAERLGPLQAPHTLQLRNADTASDAASGWDAAARALHADIDALLLSLWLDGGAQPLIALAARIQALRTRARAQGWCWIDDALAELRHLLQARQARSTRFAPLALLDLVVGLWARLQSAAQLACQAAPALPAAQVLGIGVKGEVALDRLRLVSLGAALWRDEREEGASVLWADPDTQSVTVMARQWPLEAQAPARIGERRVAGHPLRQLAASQVITQRATRSANGTINVAAQRQHTGLLPLSPRALGRIGGTVAPSRPGGAGRAPGTAAAGLHPATGGGSRHRGWGASRLPCGAGRRAAGGACRLGPGHPDPACRAGRARRPRAPACGCCSRTAPPRRTRWTCWPAYSMATTVPCGRWPATCTCRVGRW
ncbi:hypothetical protein V8017_02910 [Stenotrophomonas rhizophila]